MEADLQNFLRSGKNTGTDAYMEAGTTLEAPILLVMAPAWELLQSTRNFNILECEKICIHINFAELSKP